METLTESWQPVFRAGRSPGDVHKPRTNWPGFSAGASQQRGRVGNRAVHRAELRVIRLRNLDAVHLPQLHDDVEKVHAVQFHPLAERTLSLRARQVFVRSDPLQNAEDDPTNVGGAMRFSVSQKRRFDLLH